MIDPNPECSRKDCKFIETPGVTTLAYYPPIYDKNGVNTNPDMNTSTSTLECLTCCKRWRYVTQCGEIVFTEIKT